MRAFSRSRRHHTAPCQESALTDNRRSQATLARGDTGLGILCWQVDRPVYRVARTALLGAGRVAILWQENAESLVSSVIFGVPQARPSVLGESGSGPGRRPPSTGLADYELRRERHLPRRVISRFDAVEQETDHLVAHRFYRMPHARQRRYGRLGYGLVVESNHGDVVRNPTSRTLELSQSRRGHRVRGDEQAVEIWVALEQEVRGPDRALLREVPDRLERRVDRQPSGPERVSEAQQSVEGGRHVERAGDRCHFPSPLGDEVRRRRFGTAAAVCVDVAGSRAPRRPTVDDDRYPSGRKAFRERVVTAESRQHHAVDMARGDVLFITLLLLA